MPRKKDETPEEETAEEVRYPARQDLLDRLTLRYEPRYFLPEACVEKEPRWIFWTNWIPGMVGTMHDDDFQENWHKADNSALVAERREWYVRQADRLGLDYETAACVNVMYGHHAFVYLKLLAEAEGFITYATFQQQILDEWADIIPPDSRRNNPSWAEALFDLAAQKIWEETPEGSTALFPMISPIPKMAGSFK